ncbi:MAG: hypothetical protein J6T18_03030 [Bacteroidaceae bacterium]|nr:hypothetical protein [Bacteroidaceae bacterium]MBO7588381.1 hypothetical protein [Bacteroidaceae bacterium]MBP5647408.1 hypothetical protein [Bacteroidaceae bacterium]
MGMFSVREPRRFEHKYIYYDERKDRLAKMEEKAKRELGMLPEETYNPENIRGKFVEGTRHLKRRKENGGPRMSIQTSVVLILALLFVLHWLMTGKFFI